MTSSNTVQQMKSDWDARATTNSKYYIASWNKNWTPETFFASGELDVQTLTTTFFKANHFDPSDKVMLEIGCGTGRMTHTFAQNFRTVYAVDVSPEMLRQAALNLAACSNVCLLPSSGYDLAQFADRSLDFCFSYLVFQHIPDPNIVGNYVAEISRVLKPGGLFKIHLRSRRWHTLFLGLWRIRRLMFRLWPGRRLPLLDTHSQFDHLEGEKIERCETWVGSSVPYHQLKDWLQTNQFEAQITSAGVSGTVWVYGSKK